MCQPHFPKYAQRSPISSVTLFIVVIILTPAEHQCERRKRSTLLSEGYGTMVFVFFICEGILDGCKERLECICVCNILCL